MNLNARAAARLLNVSLAKVHEWADAGELPSYRVQEQLRFNRVELLEWAASRGLKVSPDLFADDDERPRAGGGGLRLSRALAASGIARDIAAGSERAALEALAARLPLPEGIDRPTVTALFAAREGVTPVGGGVAIPHARSPVVLPLAEPIVALGFLAQPIDLGAKDGRPVGALFVVFSPTVRLHLEALSKIAYALADPAVRAVLDRRAPDAEIIAALRAIEGEPGRGAEGERGAP
jgi:PTS system nitrogen regulatory IIA component